MFLSVQVKGQVSYHEIKSALIIQFAKKTEWNNNVEGKEFVIGLLGTDTTTFQLLDQFNNSVLKDKKAKVVHLDNIVEAPPMQLLYVSESENYQIVDIAQSIKAKNVLLVTENCKNAKYVMLNIIKPKNDKNVSFQINRSNLISEGLEVDSDLTLLGGSEIDVRDLVREMRENLEKQDQELQRQDAIISQQSTKIEEQLNAIELQNRENDLLREESEDLKSEILSNQTRLIKLQNQQDSLLNAMNAQSLESQRQSLNISNQREQILDQDKLINLRTQKLNELEAESAERQAIIDQQMSDLSSKEKVISNQRILFWSSVAISALIIMLTIVLYVGYRNRKILANQLKQSHDNLENKNNELVELNKSLVQQKEELSEALNQLEETQVQLLQSEKMAALGVLTAGVAHEINNPLNFIHAGSVLLGDILDDNQKQLTSIMEDGDTEHITKLMENIKLGTSRIRKIVSSLSSFSRSEDDEFKMCDLHSIIETTLVILQHEYKNKVEIVKNFHPEPIEIWANESKLYQVLTNLVVNAIHAIEKEGKIVIESKKEEDGITLKIIDNGFGIPNHIQDKIFDPFFTTKETGKGTGLGLSIVYNLLDEHSASINVSSEESVGTEFLLTFPVITTQEK